MKINLLSLLVCFTVIGQSQNIYNLNFTSSHDSSSDTTIFFNVGDSLAVFNYTNDTDFDVMYNGLITLSYTSIITGDNIFGHRAVDPSITSIRVTNVSNTANYRRIFLDFSATGISTQNRYSEVTIFPNPISKSELLSISGADQIDHISLFSTLGNYICSIKRVNDAKCQFPELASGTYLLRIHFNRGGNVVKRVNIK